MTRKLVTLLLALCMALTMLPASLAEEDLSQYRITDEPVTIILVRSDNSNQPMQLDSPTLKRIEEITGVTLENRMNAVLVTLEVEPESTAEQQFFKVKFGD